ncbi:MAG: tRNA (guanosine(18)-2'-O)-methyltransferase TrmH [Gammaproteobacteria bacterium]|nr:MAG: tRNA (guanosine(18)-2'-O)-methyltransferase TrmH [Gammaproteobacteria bacterium]
MTERRLRRIEEVLSRRQPDLTVVMENVNKAHNLAAIARSCDAVGVGEIHAVSGSPRVALAHKVASGASRWVRIRRQASILEACDMLKQRGFQILAAHLDDSAVDYREIDYTRPTALLVGAELFGVSELARSQADRHIVIPMLGMVQSLNVSVATALVLFEAQHQRLAAGCYDRPRLSPEEYQRLLEEWTSPAPEPESLPEGRISHQAREVPEQFRDAGLGD